MEMEGGPRAQLEWRGALSSIPGKAGSAEPMPTPYLIPIHSLAQQVPRALKVV